MLPTEARVRSSAFVIHVLFAWWMYGDVSLTFSIGRQWLCHHKAEYDLRKSTDVPEVQ